MSNPFEYINAINETKKDLMTGSPNDFISEKEYKPFLTNRALSNFKDTVLIANEMNMRAHVDNKLQFHFFLNIVRPRRRFAPWAKKEKDADIDLLKEYYGCGDSKARSYKSILSPDQIDEIRRIMDKGGSE